MVLGVGDLLAADTKKSAFLVRGGDGLRDAHHELLVRVGLGGRRLRSDKPDRVAELLRSNLTDVALRVPELVGIDCGRGLDRSGADRPGR